MSYHVNMRGLGATVTGSTIIGSVGGSLLAAAPFAGPAAPFVAVAGAIADVMASFGVGSGCGQTCIQSAAFANQANAVLQQNIETYFSLPTPRAKSAQTAAAANFMQFWNWLISGQACGNPNLGAAGQRCISDRQQGACTWKQPASAVPPWGTPAAGECWNWWNGYYLPIVNDPNTYDDSIASTLGTSGGASSSIATPGAASGTVSVAGVSIPVWALAAVALVGVLAVAS